MNAATTNIVTIIYNSSIKVQAGWRDVKIKARAEKINAGMAAVRDVIEIDGETPAYGQSFDGKALAAKQVGAKKRLSACEVCA